MSTITAATPQLMPRIQAAPTPPAPTPAPTDGTSAGVNDDFLHQLITLKNAADVEKFKAALTAEITATASGAVQPWRTPHVEKPAFNGTVQKQGQIYGPQAAAQVSQNLAEVLGILANPEVGKALLIGVESRIHPEQPPATHDLAEPDFRQFYNGLRQSASNRHNFEYSGTLVNVGWGSGDHVNVTSSHLPSGPKTVSGNLANDVTRFLLTPPPTNPSV